MSLKSLFICVSALMMTACASLTLPSAPVEIQASLRQPCPPLEPLADPTGKTVLKWGVATAKAYRLCADRMDALIEATEPVAGD